MNQVRQGRFHAGDQLPAERELAATLGVNRTTLREALRVLEFMRVVEKRVGEGVFVRDLDSSIELLVFRFLNEDGLDAGSVRSAFEAVTCLEATTARLAAQRATPEEVAQLTALTEKMAGQVPEEEFSRLDHDFHLLVGRLSASPVLSTIVSTVWIIVRRYAALLHRDAQRRQACAAGHRRIVDAIAAGDGELAAREMERHLQGAGRALFGPAEDEAGFLPVLMG